MIAHYNAQRTHAFQWFTVQNCALVPFSSCCVPKGNEEMVKWVGGGGEGNMTPHPCYTPASGLRAPRQEERTFHSPTPPPPLPQLTARPATISHRENRDISHTDRTATLAAQRTTTLAAQRTATLATQRTSTLAAQRKANSH